MLLTAAPAAAQDSVVVGVVYDGPNDRMGAQQEKFVEELLVLTEREFNVQIKDFSGDWTRESMLGVLDEAYADPTVDFVLVIGFVTNQLAATREVFPKPTFLPAILDTGLLQSEPVDGKESVDEVGSGRPSDPSRRVATSTPSSSDMSSIAATRGTGSPVSHSSTMTR